MLQYTIQNNINYFVVTLLIFFPIIKPWCTIGAFAFISEGVLVLVNRTVYLSFKYYIIIYINCYRTFIKYNLVWPYNMFGMVYMLKKRLGDKYKEVMFYYIWSFLKTKCIQLKPIIMHFAVVGNLNIVQQNLSCFYYNGLQFCTVSHIFFIKCFYHNIHQKCIIIIINFSWIQIACYN